MTQDPNCYGCATMRHSCEHDDEPPFHERLLAVRDVLADLHASAVKEAVAVGSLEWERRFFIMCALTDIETALKNENALQWRDRIMEAAE